MATTAQVKPQALKNIGNVPDWVRVKDKKDKDAPRTIHRRPTKPRVSTAHVQAPAVTTPTKPPVIPQPIIEEVKDPIENGVQSPPAGSKVRRIYSREFLIKFKYSATPFPPGAITPQDIINQYNKEFELRERQAQEKAAVSTIPPSTPAAMNEQGTTESTTEVPRVATEKKIKREKKTEGGDKKAFKLRGLGATDESILRSPLFRASANKLASGSKRASSPFTPANSDDKENPTVSSAKTARASISSSNKRRATSPLVIKSEAQTTITTKTQKLPTTSSSLTPAPATPAAVSTPTPATPAPAVIPAPTPITPEPLAAPTPAPTPAAIKTEQAGENAAVGPMEDTKQDAVDILTKKLKAVLKETDARRLAQRQKQIEYGKATPGYKDYSKLIAKSKRKREDPKTPNKYQVCSKRSWDGQIRKWRRMLHFYDPADLKDAQANPDMGDDVDAKPETFEVTAADILREENALRE